MKDLREVDTIFGYQGETNRQSDFSKSVSLHKENSDKVSTSEYKEI